MGDFQIAGVWTRSERELHINVLELRAVILALHHWATVLQGLYVLIATDNHCCSLHQQTRWDPFPPPVAAGSGSVSVATDSGHNSKSQTHSRLPKCDSRLVVSAETAHHDRVESPPRSRESDIQTVGNSSNGHVCHSPQHISSPVHMYLVPEPRALVIDSMLQD